jgi:hypothetical protein
LPGIRGTPFCKLSFTVRRAENPSSVVPSYWDDDDFAAVAAPLHAYNRSAMEPDTHLTREREIEAVMGVFGVDRRTADALLAREHSRSAGDCVALTKEGEEIPLRTALRLKKTKPAA